MSDPFLSGNAVSVVVPLFNKASTVCEAITSIVKQTVTPTAIIVVDDGSTDGSEALVAAMSIPSLTLIRQKNAGPGAARNVGMVSVKSRYVAFLDADDLWLPDHLENLLHGARMAPDLPLYANQLAPWSESNFSTGIQALQLQTFDDYPRQWLNGLTVSTCAVMVDRAKAVAAGGFATTSHRGEDLALWLKLTCGPDLDSCHSFAISNRIGALYRQEASDLTRIPIASPDAAMQLISNRLASNAGIASKTRMTLVDFRARLALLHAAEWIRHGGRIKAKEFISLAADTNSDQALRRKLSLLAGPLWSMRSGLIALRRRFKSGTSFT